MKKDTNSFKIIDIIGAPSDLGANQRGAAMGPAAIRTANLHEELIQSGRKTNDLGDIYVPIRFTLDESNTSYQHLYPITKICQDIKSKALSSLNNNHLPLLLGGDHSLSIGSLAATCEYHKNKELGLLWIDTHADINTPETSPSGNIHGMPINTLLGNGYASLIELFNEQQVIKPEHIVFIGLRDIDKAEKKILAQSNIKVYSMRDVDELGIQYIMKQIHDQIFNNIDGIHLSFDLDVMDPLQVPGVSTPVSGGLTLREAHLLLEMVYESNKLVSADFMELNPMNDIKGQSAKTAVDLICSLFGKTIF